ncbi:GNAT family N-acetyltransferase [Pseudovibrio sp. SPO723]|uniref:GNAT family N-acetyltransferase n=1 Tax=Nesiotobacter zosterae TaxID=392721 RepID=UPI0029C18103|nr:GNAT family N-acetyltransferase [Pseudovibrio sp. SPO723]MDX5594213.1 GNAT family N-acetyltransferase [Pseudovibrio sp. SPO723]
MSSAVLKVVKPHEVQEAEQLLHAGFAEYARGAGRSQTGPYPWLADSVAREMVLFWKGRAGIVVLDEGTAEGRVTLSMFALAPDQQGTGQAAQMMASVVDEVAARGFHVLELYTLEQYGHLRRFYERLGFVLERKGRHPTQKDDLTRIFMARKVTENGSVKPLFQEAGE